MISNNDVIILIMAGGLGKRMNSNIPKVLHKFNNKPMIIHTIENSLLINPKKILIVVGKYYELIKEIINQYIEKDNLSNIEYIIQDTPLGTGHALLCAKEKLYNNNTNDNNKLLILSGDTPLIDLPIMNNMIDDLKNFKICTTSLQNPYGYGRIVNIQNSNYTKIVEEKDCTNEQKIINKINCGIYSIKISLLLKYIDNLTNNNNQSEYYLTDLVEIITKEENILMEFYEIDNNNNYKILGVNTPEQLQELQKYII